MVETPVIAVLPGPLVDVDWLASHLDAPDLLILDAHVAWGEAGPDPAKAHAEWAEGHIPGAIHADLVMQLSDTSSPFGFTMPAPGDLARRLSALGLSDDRRVILYDRFLNMWAARLWWMLRAIGFDRAAVLDGGWNAWVSAGQPQQPGEPPPPPHGPLTVQPRNLFAGLPEVAAIVAGRGSHPLVCALPGDIFRGETPLYGHAGHIPGSLSLPAATLLDEAGHFLPAHRLADRLAPLLEGPSPILYCGGGVSAAVIALALAVIGKDAGARIYDGSIEEWGADPARPLATARKPPRTAP